MRLFPPVPATGRVLAQPTDIVGYKMPKGTPTVANIYAVHRHPDFWENPDVRFFWEVMCDYVSAFSLRTSILFASLPRGQRGDTPMPTSHSLLDQGMSNYHHKIITRRLYFRPPRNCIGQEFALNEEKVVLANILRHFEISLDETKPVMKEYLAILKPKDGLHLKLKHRSL